MDTRFSSQPGWDVATRESEVQERARFQGSCRGCSQGSVCTDCERLLGLHFHILSRVAVVCRVKLRLAFGRSVCTRSCTSVAVLHLRLLWCRVHSCLAVCCWNCTCQAFRVLQLSDGEDAWPSERVLVQILGRRVSAHGLVV